MGKPSETADRIKERIHPSAIASELGISESSVHSYIYRAIGEGRIDFVDVLFALGAEERSEYEQLFENGELLSKEARIVERYERFAIAEIYSQIREIEQKLHSDIKSALVAEYGSEEAGWWRNGVPKKIRADCVRMREQDDLGADHPPFAYTMFNQLADIAKHQWKILQGDIAYLTHMKLPAFLSQMDALHRIRNQVAHPVRIRIPSDDDIVLVQKFRNIIHATS